ncbi:MAG: hypothetical protein NTW18_04230 [Candidatus Omnitrophica bacterium]|nr:hypothetical protein [Candidatus Omnitrophota bacterium]
MGVIYKIKPEVRDFILEQKNNSPSLSCRKLTALVLDNFKIELSKSSINMIIKEAGLSAPVGRTPKKKRRHIAMPNLPILLEDASVRQVERTGQEEEEKAREEEERKVKEETEKKAREEVVKKEQEELLAQEEKLKSEEEVARKIEEEKWARIAEEERLAKESREEAERKAKEEELSKAREEEERKAQVEATAHPVANVEKFHQIEDSGIILLEAADYIIGASKLIAAAIKSRLPDAPGNLEDLVENLIYLPLFQEKAEKAFIDKLSGYLEKIENIKVINLDISRIIASSLQEARCVKVILSDGANLYLDASMYSVWSSPHIPYDFASPIHNLKKYINQYFNEDYPLVIFNAPGYDMPSQEFFNLLEALDGRGNAITNLVISGNKFEELEVLPVNQAKKRFFVFGVWPWQFTECRRVKNLGEFRLFRLEEQNKDLYIADIEMELRQPTKAKQIVLNGCVLKTSLTEKTRLVLLSNFSVGTKKAEELVALYFNHWPNLEEAFQDYSRKIELFTYTANSQRYFSAENINLGLAQVSTVKDLFASYLAAIDAYVRWHLLPSGYEDKEFTATRERFYNLIAEPTRKKRSCLMKFVLPPAYAFDKDLSYLCRRINEKEVVLSSGHKLYLTTE